MGTNRSSTEIRSFSDDMSQSPFRQLQWDNAEGDISTNGLSRQAGSINFQGNVEYSRIVDFLL